MVVMPIVLNINIENNVQITLAFCGYKQYASVGKVVRKKGEVRKKEARNAK